MKHKDGLYAKYCKVTGSFIKTEIKKSNQIYASNMHSKIIFWDLLTEDINLMYDYPKDSIPSISPNFDEIHCFEASPSHYKCDLCGEYFEKKDMCHIHDPNNKDDSFVSQCKYC